MVIHFQQKTKITTVTLIIALRCGKELGGTTTVITATSMVSIFTENTRVVMVLGGVDGNQIQLNEQK